MSGPPPRSDHSPAGVSESDALVRTTGRGGLAITAAKAYFILTGLLQQLLLPRVLGMDGYGALASALSIASICYNPITTSSIQGVSRALSHAEPLAKPLVLRRVLEMHLALAVLSGGLFLVGAPLIASSIGAPHIAPALRFLSLVLFLYSLYTPLIGALNAEKRFLHQAGFDIASATLRTLGLVLGALWFRSLFDRGVEGAAIGFAATSTLMLIAAFIVVGVGNAQGRGFQRRAHLRFMLPLLLGQVLFNVLLQADLTLLRYFASGAVVVAGATAYSADALVGTYRAIQLFGFLPFQLLVALTFVIFPMLARADADADIAKIRQYVQTGMRISVMAVGLLVSVISGVAGLLLKLVFPSPIAELGTHSLQLLSLGLGCFAIFSVLVSVLNSLRRERVSLAITGISVLLVAIGSTLLARGEVLGEGLLFRIAAGTSLGLFSATVSAAVLVRRLVGRLISPLTLLRVLSVTAASIVLARQLPDLGKLTTVAYSVIVALTYLVLLAATRELSGSDLALLRGVFSRQARRSA